MKALAGNSRSNLIANIRGVSLAEVRRTLGAAAATPSVAFAGAINASATASWGKSFDDLVAHTDATITAQASGAPVAGKAAPERIGTSKNVPAAPAGAIPVDSAIHATYTAGNQQLAFTQSYLRTPQTNLTMNGVVSKRSSLALRLQANDLREVATIANLSEPRRRDKPRSRSSWLALSLLREPFKARRLLRT